MRLARWETIVSDSDELYCIQHLNRGAREDGLFQFSFAVEDREKQCYEAVLLEEPYLYIVVDEEHLTKYWSVKEKGIGWTFKVEDSPLAKVDDWPEERGELQHFVVSTCDICLEVLAPMEPVVRRVGREKQVLCSIFDSGDPSGRHRRAPSV